MKQCVKFPEDKFLAVRPCLVAICMGIRPAAHLLSILLFRFNLRLENKDDAENQNAIKRAKGVTPDQDISYRIFRTQAQLVDDMCGEMTEKTLHDTAVPMLQLLGFLDLEEHMAANCYTVYVDRVQQALDRYLPGKEKQPELEKFLISTMQLEKFLITSDELEKSLIDKKKFLLQLEKVLIQNRNTSNCKRGRRPNPQAARRAKSKRPKNSEEPFKKSNEERENASAHAPTRAPAVSLAEESENDVRPTPKFMSAPFWRPPSESRESEMTHDELARGDSALRGDRGSEPIGDRLPAHSHPATAAQAQVAPQQTAPTLSQDGAARTSPSGPRASGGKATPTKRAPKADELPLKCDTAEVRKRLASKRGYALEDKTEIIRENTAVKAWCAKHDLDVCDVVLAHLTMYDPYWSKPENKYRICGWHLLKETPRVLAELERRRKLAPPQPAREEALYTAPLPVLAPVREARRR